MTKLAPILLAEDDVNDVLLFTCALKHTALPTPLIVSRDGQQTVDFLELLARYRDRFLHPLPCLLLLDLKMPRLSGFDVLAWLQKRPDLQSVPAVVLSSSPQAPDMLIARELGAVDYRVKPACVEDYAILIKDVGARWVEHKTPMPVAALRQAKTAESSSRLLASPAAKSSRAPAFAF